MDGLKEILAAFEARVRSKVVGSVILTFIATNWKVIFYVMFAKKTVETKFTYFDDHTSILTLLIIPVFVGVLLALFLPLVNYWALKITSKIDRKLLDFKNESHSVNELSKLKYAAEREEYIARLKTATVESAKADKEVQTIKDTELKNNNKKIPRVKIKAKSMSLEAFQKSIEQVQAHIEDMLKFQKSIKKGLFDLSNAEELNKKAYEESLAKFIKKGDEKGLLTLKLSRAKALEEYNRNFMALERDLEMVSKDLKIERDAKNTLMADFDKKYQL